MIKSTYIVGLGKSGFSAAAWLRAQGTPVQLWDDTPAQQDLALKEGYTLTPPDQISYGNLQELVLSPGIAASHESAHQAKAHHVPIICDVELWLRQMDPQKVLAVTGTNGKSTTTALLTHVLTQLGMKAAMGGNIGIPALEIPLDVDWAILELSSYQLERVPSLQVRGGIFLNLTPDHLDRHGGMEPYFLAKKRLFQGALPHHVAVVGVDDTYGGLLAQELPGCRRMATTSQNADYFYKSSGLWAKNDLSASCKTEDLQALQGVHNAQNALAVWALAEGLGYDRQSILKALKTFPGLAHRQERVLQHQGLTFINDSKGTNADATAKALASFQNIYWIAGGQAKEGGIQTLSPYFARVKHAFLMGEAQDQFAATLEAAQVPYTRCGTLSVAVPEAAALAQKNGGGVVLLSPACASWDQFKNFEDRGQQFCALVQGLYAPEKNAS